MNIFPSKTPTLFLIVLILCSFTVNAARLLEPGNTLILQSETMPVSADGTDASCEEFPAIPPTPVYVSCGTEQAGQEFGVRATAQGAFARGQGTALQFYDFEVDEGDGSETPLLSQISGKANFNGFLALVGGGQVKGNLKLKLIDLGRTGALYPDGGKVVHQETLASHQLSGLAITGIGFAIGGIGGAPVIAASAGANLKFNIALKKELVRDKIDFGVHALLLRGHTYRLQFEAGALAKKDVVPGLSIAQFKLGDDRAPDLLDPEKWLDGINDLINSDLPALKPQLFSVKQETLVGEILEIRHFANERYLSEAKDFTDSKDLLLKIADEAGIPTTFREIVEQRLSKSTILEEGIPSPGAEIRELYVTLETDQVEMLKHIIDLLNTPPGQRPTFPLKIEDQTKADVQQTDSHRRRSGLSSWSRIFSRHE